MRKISHEWTSNDHHGRYTDAQWLSWQRQDRFYTQLHRETRQLEHSQEQALSAAVQEHERVRHDVEVERQLLETRLQAERHRRETLALQEAERVRQQQQEIQHQRIVEQEQIERQKQLELQQQVNRQNQQAELTRQKQRENQEVARKAEQWAQEKQELDRKKQLELQQRLAQERKTLAERAPPLAAHQGPNAEKEHTIYVEIHRRLKTLRGNVVKEAREHPALKHKLGEMRRQITKSVGQLTEGRTANRQPLSTILGVLREATAIAQPAIDPTHFIAHPPESSGQGSAVLLYLLNIVSKAVIAQFINEAGVSPKSADPVGIIASHVFAHPDFKWQGTSLIDIFLAKFHVVCPVLFGISGSEKSQEGRRRLGWWREDAEGPYVTEQRHFERMTGLAAGFAALALRNFEKSKLENPFPPGHYWTALARVANVPAEHLTPTHFVILKALIEHHEVKFLNFFGGPAMVLLQKLVLELPRQVTPSVASQSFAGMVDLLAREEKIYLRV